MKILVRKEEGLVIYADPGLVLTSREVRVGRVWRDPHFNTDNAFLVDADTPADFVPGVSIYQNGKIQPIPTP